MIFLMTSNDSDILQRNSEEKRVNRQASKFDMNMDMDMDMDMQEKEKRSARNGSDLMNARHRDIECK